MPGPPGRPRVSTDPVRTPSSVAATAGMATGTGPRGWLAWPALARPGHWPLISTACLASWSAPMTVVTRCRAGSGPCRAGAPRRTASPSAPSDPYSVNGSGPSARRS